MARPAMRCDFVAPDGTLLSDYPWTGSREVRPGSNQWIHVPSDLQYGDLTGRHIVQSGKCQGSLANSHARTHIDIGSPMRRALLKLQASRTDIEIDNSFNFRVPAGNPPGSPVYYDWLGNPKAMYHSVQVLWNPGYSPHGLMNIWGVTTYPHLIAQVPLSTVVVWTATTQRSVWRLPATYPANGASVLPPVANGFKYDVVASSGADPTYGDSGALEPTWPVTPGETVVDGELPLRCPPNVDWQTQELLLEVIDTGSIIIGRFGGMEAVGYDTDNNQNTWVGFWNYWDSQNSVRSRLEVWT